MKIVAVTMVKDEADIIQFTIENLFRQGVDEVVAADNLSHDRTRAILDELAVRLPVHVQTDDVVGYYQSEKMTQLAYGAFSDLAADVVVPFDADEYWTGVGMSLRDAIWLTPGDILQVPLWNYFPRTSDIAHANPFERITHCQPGSLGKVMVRRMDNFVIHQGNHSAAGDGAVVTDCTSAAVGHFPWRSYEQFERKVRNGYAAYLAADLPEDQGAHWRNYGELLEDQGSEALEALYREWFEDPPGETENRPVLELYSGV